MFYAESGRAVTRSKLSAGLLVYREDPTGVLVLVCHPGGPLFAKKDLGHWTIPKGEPDDGETDLLAVAQRETHEETGLVLGGPFVPLGSIVQKGGKHVHAWGAPWPRDVPIPALVSNTFEMEWPPRSGRRQQFPEVDQMAFVDLPTARARLKETQWPFLDRLAQALASRG